MIHRSGIVVVLALVLVAAAPAPENRNGKPGDTKSVDATLYQTLKEVINRGAELYNAGEPGACYRLFEGSLMSVRPLLDHRPEVQKMIVRGLASAERDPLTWRRAFTLRSVLDKVRAELNPNRQKDADKLGVPRVEEEKKGEKEKGEDEKPAKKEG